MEQCDVVGIGVGPSNLSLAALARPVAGLRARFLEARPRFQWHPGMMLPGARLQVSYLKDLVTLIDPTSRYSYLNFLVHHGRIYRSLIANQVGCSRQEFEQYYQWVADQLPGIHWGQRVKSVQVADAGFEVVCEEGGRFAAPALVLGSGRVPALPDFAAVFEGRDVLHSNDLLHVRPAVRGRRVVVVGAGQSGAEVVDHLLADDRELPASLLWISSRVGFLPLDDSPFSNEWFAPPYVDHFQTLPPERRTELLRHQRLASDGISETLLRTIYRRLYELDIAGGRLRHHLLPNRRVTDLRSHGSSHGSGLAVTLREGDTGKMERSVADVVIFCTGYRSPFPDYMEPLRERLVNEHGDFRIRPDYSLEWDGPDHLRIYVQNWAESTHGIADPNLSLGAWRSAQVINSLTDQEIYRLDGFSTTVTWARQPELDQDRDRGAVPPPPGDHIPVHGPFPLDLAPVEGR